MKRADLVFAAILLFGARPCASESPGQVPAAPEPDRPIIVSSSNAVGSAVAELAGTWSRSVVLAGDPVPMGAIAIPDSIAPLVGQAAVALRTGIEPMLDSRLLATGLDGKKIAEVGPGTDLTLPDAYLKLCARVAEVLCHYFPERSYSIRLQLPHVYKRIDAEAGRQRARLQAVLWKSPLLVSETQGGFLNWVGAEVVSTYGRGDAASAAWVEENRIEVVERHLVGVVGSAYWDGSAVYALAGAVGVPAVNLLQSVADAEPGAFDRLLGANVDSLLLLVRKGQAEHLEGTRKGGLEHERP